MRKVSTRFTIMALSALAALVASIALTAPVSAVDQLDEQWFPTVAAGESGSSYQGLLIQENAKNTEKMSSLTCGGNGNDASKLRWCSSLDDPNNQDKSLAPGFDAILPKCVDEKDKNCIAGISAVTPDGKVIQGTYTRNIPEKGNSDFAAAPERNFPAGTTPSLWQIPGVANSSGADQYLVRFTLRGTVMSSFDSRCPGCTNFKGYSAIITPVSIVKGGYAASEAFDARNIDPSICAATPSKCVPGFINRTPQECAATENGACALKAAFPKGYKFKLDVRLGASPTGWIHGRISNPKVELNKSGDFTVLSVEGEPVMVPVVGLIKPVEALPASFLPFYDSKALQGFSEYQGKQVRISMPEPDGESSFYEYEMWKGYINDKANASPQVWTYRSLTIPYASADCFKDTSKFIGVVTTNAMMYAGGPPVFNQEQGTLEYKVGAPHYTSKGDVFKGTYDLQLSSEVARCLYQFSSAPIRATISITTESGENSVATTVVNEKDGWLRMSAYGFTFSNPTVKVKLFQDAAPVVAPVPAKSVTIACTKGSASKKVTAVNPKCPKGFKKK